MPRKRQTTGYTILLASLLALFGGIGFAQEEAAQAEPAQVEDVQDQEDDPEEENKEDETPAEAIEPDQEPAPQLSEMELIVRVEELQEKILSKRIPDRDAAEKELMQLGPNVLDHLEIDLDSPTDTKDRLLRVRKHLEKLSAAAVTKPSSVTLKGNFTILEAFQRIQRQTQNDVALVEGVPDEYATKKIDLDLDKSEFWPAINAIMKQGDLAVAPYSGAAGQLRLAPTNSQDAELAENPAAKRITLPNAQAGIFNVEVTRVVSSRSLDQPNNSHTTLSLRIRWEPRIQPISVDLALANLKVIDEFDKPIAVLNEAAVVSQLVQPEIPELEFNIPLKLVDRQIEEIKFIEADINAVLPGRVETFKFKNLGDVAVGTEQDKAGVVVEFGGLSKNEDLFGLQINVGFNEGGEATESYHSWVYDNEIMLIDKEKIEHSNLGLESSAQSETRLGILYYFEVDPKECTLVYKTPAAIVKQPIKVKLEKIPLP